MGKDAASVSSSGSGKRRRRKKKGKVSSKKSAYAAAPKQDEVSVTVGEEEDYAPPSKCGSCQGRGCSCKGCCGACVGMICGTLSRCFGKWLGPFIVFVIIAYVYIMAVGVSLVPELGDKKDANTKVLRALGKGGLTYYQNVMIALHVFLGMLLLCYFRAMFTKPGSIPTESAGDRDMWGEGHLLSKKEIQKMTKIIQDVEMPDEKIRSHKKFIKSVPVAELKSSDSSLRYCKTCQLYKPDRTHHCSQCDQCVLRMDHHCPWINNCVGFFNYKYFLLLLFYVWCTLTCVMLAMAPRVAKAFPFQSLLDARTFILEDLPLFLCSFMVLGMWCVLVWFLPFHLWLVGKGLTTIENKEKRCNEYPRIQHRWKVAHLKFDRGWYGNWRHVMGPAWMWLLPISGSGGDDGTYSHVERTSETTV